MVRCGLALALMLQGCRVAPAEAEGWCCDEAHPCPGELSCVARVCCPTGAPCAALAEGGCGSPSLAGWWPLDGRDAGAGRVEGAAWTDGRVGGALQLDGVGDRVVIDDESALSSSLSLAAYVNLASLPAGREMTLVSRRSLDGKRSWRLAVDAAPAFVFCVSGDGIYSTCAVARTAPATGEWVHVAGAYDVERRAMAIWVGFEPDTAAIDGEVPAMPHASPGAVVLGEGLSGRIDDVRIFRGALQTPDVAALEP